MKKKILSVLMIMAVLLCYMPSTAFANGTTGGGTEPQTSAQQIGNYFEANDTDGILSTAPSEKLKDTLQKYETSKNFPDGQIQVNKTIKETNAENEFEVTLEVVTKDIEIKNVTSEDAAVVLVIDISGSMDNKSKLFQAKKAAQTFINSFASDTANRKVAIVTFSGSNHDYFLNGATTVQTWTDASNLKTGNNIITNKINSINAKGGTNLEAGLQLAKNLLNDSTLSGISNKNIVLLTDGEPTYGIDHSKEANYTTKTDIICNNGSNMIGNGYEGNSDFHKIHKQVETLAASIGTNIGKYAVVIGNVTLNCNGEENSAPRERKPGGGEPQPSKKCLNNMSGQTWLATKCGFTAYTTSESDLDSLTSVFQNISELIKLQAQAWILTDPMGEYIDYNGLITRLESNDGFYYNSTNDEISWNLKQMKPVETKDETTGATTRTYTLTYKIKLDNLKDGFTAERYYATNKKTSLSYLITDSSTSTAPTLKYAYFNVPSVKGLKADLEFEKKDAEGKPLSGAGFTLSTTGYTATATSDAEGKVSFKNIPSGHTYTLEETTVPAGYEKAANKNVKVSYGELDSTSPYYDGSAAIINESANTSVSVTKVWNDSNDQDGKRPGNVTVNLLANGTVKQSAELTAANDWKYTFTDLPKMADGNTIEYTVSEDAVADYTTAITGTAAAGYTITNTHTPETIAEISGTKTWNDGDNQDRKRPDSITVRLFANGVETDSKTVTADTNGDWKYSFTNLPKYSNAAEIIYTITEDAVDGYTSTVDGYNVINSYTPDETSITVTKAWNDNNNQDGKRPTSVTVKLLADNVDTGKSVTLNASNNWSAQFTGLAVNKDGNKITYTVAETDTDSDYYTSSVSGDATTGFTITNTHTPEKITVSGTKTWNDNNNAAEERPTSITVKLLANGTETKSTTVTADADGNWTYSFTDLPKYANGRAITYTVSEDAVPDYTTAVEGYNITNTYSNDTSVEVKVNKVWDDNEDKAGKRPESVTVKLLADGKATNETVTLNADNEWKASFTALEKYKKGVEIKYTVEEESVENYTNAVSGSAENGFTVTNTYAPPKTSVTVTKIWDHGENTVATDQPTSVTVKLLADGTATGNPVTLSEDNSWSHTFTGLAMYAANGTEIAYTVSEEAVTNYTSVTTGSAEQGFTITNTYQEPQEPEPPTPTTGSLTITKTKSGAAATPADATFTLANENGTTVATATYSWFTNGSYTFTNLPLGTYTVTETGADVGGYTLTTTYKVGSEETATVTVAASSTATIEIHNTYEQNPPTPETGRLIITKTTSGATTPDGSTFILKNENGAQVGSATYAEFNNDGYIFSNLPFGNYTVEETNAAVGGYTLTTTYKVGDVATATAKVTNDGVPTIAISNVYEKNGDDTPTPPPTTDKFRLTLNKQVLGVDNIPTDYEVRVTVSNKFGPVKVLTLKANEPQTIYLSRGDYTLTEDAPAIDGYSLKSQEFSADSFYLTYGGQDVTITNTYAKDAEVPEEPEDNDNKDQDDKNPPIEPKEPGDDNGADDVNESDVPKTGDSMSLFLYALTAAGALFGLRKLSKRETE